MVKQSESFSTVGYIHLYVFLVSPMAANTCSALLCFIIPVVLTDENKLFVGCGLYSGLSSSDYIKR
jgi:hypothetical protein